MTAIGHDLMTPTDHNPMTPTDQDPKIGIQGAELLNPFNNSTLLSVSSPVCP